MRANTRDATRNRDGEPTGDGETGVLEKTDGNEEEGTASYAKMARAICRVEWRGVADVRKRRAAEGFGNHRVRVWKHRLPRAICR